MYKKVSTDMNFVSREKEVEKFWDDNEIFQKSMDEKEGLRITAEPYWSTSLATLEKFWLASEIETIVFVLTFILHTSNYIL